MKRLPFAVRAILPALLPVVLTLVFFSCRGAGEPPSGPPVPSGASEPSGLPGQSEPPQPAETDEPVPNEQSIPEAESMNIVMSLFPAVPQAESFNRVTFRYTSPSPLALDVIYSVDGEWVEDTFYLEAGEDGVFSALIKPYLKGKTASDLRFDRVLVFTGKRAASDHQVQIFAFHHD